MAARILVVDDEPDVVKLISITVTTAGFEVATASNGAECLLEIEAHKPDLIILDITMPVLDGFQTLRLLREKQETASLPVIMLTASKREGDVLEGWKTGVDYYLTKPFDVQELVAAIKRVLESTAIEGEQT